MPEEPLWTFALALYGRPGAAPACLALQDEAGADVPLVLHLLWCAATGRTLDAAAIAATDAALAPWRDAVVAPLRRVRRAMKAPLLPAPGAEALRERVKAAEIEAERLALRALAALAPPPGARTDATAAAWRHLDLYAAHLGRPLPRAPCAALVHALAGG
ncbi:TIGR02444 family protein [Methylobacterium sp. WSM2598]|uniref:TIGR02444 family protein n=1 Tax=Methylobacterium sp. WSM2598 TaxID=398261 RepID=UPI0003A577D7|nr:TIGR02444 family protein [Methylobacterium sp. WSM2598]